MSFKTDKHEPIIKVIDFEASDAKETKQLILKLTR